jgi:hypothetical protein
MMGRNVLPFDCLYMNEPFTLNRHDRRIGMSMLLSLRVACCCESVCQIPAQTLISGEIPWQADF